MKKHISCMMFLLALCLVPALAPAARASGSGNTIAVGDGGDLRQALASASDGDTIQLSGTVTVSDPSSQDAPWVIDKAVTIQGGLLVLRTSGVILDKDVTFRGVTLLCAPFVRNAIMANGHTLVLEDVTCSASSRPVNLFCGGLYEPGGFGSDPGPEGKIVLRGTVSLLGDGTCGGVGSLYAGNLCMGGMNPGDDHIDGPANEFAGDAEICVEASAGIGDLGPVYACGAQQRIPRGSQSGKVTLPDPDSYTVGGRVTVRLRDGAVRWADGAGAGEAALVYNGSEDPIDFLTLSDFSSLAVETGYLIPAADSGLREGAAVSVGEGGRLGLDQLGNLTVGSFTGGGALRLGQDQTLAITGAAAGSTRVVIGGFAYDGGSSLKPAEGHIYISAPNSGPDAFVLAPNSGFPDMALVRDGGGNWSVPAREGEDPPILVESLSFQDVDADSGIGEAELALDAAYVENGASFPYVDFIPLTIRINGQRMERLEEDGYYTYTLALGEDVATLMVTGDCLSITMETGGAVPDGVYAIELAVPGTNTASGGILWAGAVLRIGGGGPEPSPWRFGMSSMVIEDKRAVVHLRDAAGAEGGTVFAAAYTAEDRMRGISLAAVSGEGEVSLPLDSTGASYVTVFLVDEQTRPVSLPQTAPGE